jgi:hypothetical protein
MPEIPGNRWAPFVIDEIRGWPETVKGIGLEESLSRPAGHWLAWTRLPRHLIGSGLPFEQIQQVRQREHVPGAAQAGEKFRPGLGLVEDNQPAPGDEPVPLKVEGQAVRRLLDVEI